MANRRAFRLWLLVPAVYLLSASAALALVSIDWVTVGDAGNSCETQTQGCFGAVSYEYRIDKYEVTNAQYTEFLNAVAATDPNGLYDASASTLSLFITRSGSSGSYSYSVVAGHENMPVNHVSWLDTLRFANWLHNGQPTGAQGSTTTEDGAYDMSLGSSVVRKAGAKAYLTSLDEWYKAAYYKGGGTSAGYWDYPAGSDTQTICTAPGATANTANCYRPPPLTGTTDVGSYTGSASPSGTFDQGGNVWEWNEAIVTGSFRGFRGSYHFGSASALAATDGFTSGDPTYEGYNLGFRVASTVPESPPVPSLSLFGITLLLSALGIAGYRKLHA